MMRRVVAWMLCVAMLVTSTPVSAEGLLTKGAMPRRTRGAQSRLLSGSRTISLSAEEGNGLVAPLPTPELGGGLVLPLPTAVTGGEATKAPEQEPEAEATKAPEQEPDAEATDAPEETPEPEATDAPAQEPDAEATDAPEQTPDAAATPGVEATDAPSQEPEVEATKAPAGEQPDVEATDAPEETPEPEATPDPEATLEPEATPEPDEDLDPASLEISLTADVRSAVVGDRVRLTLNVTGGAGEKSAVYVIDVDGEVKEAPLSLSVNEGENNYVFVPSVPGLYTVTAIVRDEEGQSAQASVSVPVTQYAPLEATLTANVASAVVGERVELTLLVAGGEGEKTAVYVIGVDDEVKETPESVSVNDGENRYAFVPAVPGVYTVTAIVRDGEGQSAQASVALPVEEALPLEAALTANARSGFAGEAVNLTLNVAGGVGGLTAVYEVAAGGAVEQTSEETAVTAGDNAYAFVPGSGGEYTVTATVRDALGESAQASVSLPIAVHDTTSYAEMRARAEAVRVGEDWCENMAAIAESQLGYRESETDFIIDENGERHGYTVYGYQYGLSYDEWSVLFVCFVMGYANVTGLPFTDNVNVLRKGAQEKNALMDKTYVPERGDLVFFDRNDDESTVGVVTRVSGDSITVIEGDSNKAVESHIYALNSALITGYVRIKTLQGIGPDYSKDTYTYGWVRVEKFVEGNAADPDEWFDFKIEALQGPNGPIDTKFDGYQFGTFGKPINSIEFHDGVATFSLQAGQHQDFIFGIELGYYDPFWPFEWHDEIDYIKTWFRVTETSTNGYRTYITGGSWVDGNHDVWAGSGEWIDDVYVSMIDNDVPSALGEVDHFRTVDFKFHNVKDAPFKTETQINGKEVSGRETTGKTKPSEKVYEFPDVEIDDLITYRIDWENYQRDPVTGKLIPATVIITDKLDDGVDYVGSDPEGVYDPVEHKVTWNLGEQPPKSSGSVTLTVQVNEKATQNGYVDDQATVQVGHSSEQTGTVRNRVPTGDLEVSKTVNGSDVVDPDDYQKDFTFTVKLFKQQGDEEPAKINGTYGTGNTAMTFVDGVATFTLRHGQSKLALKLPAGYYYTVEEEVEEGFTLVLESGTTGQIPKDQKAQARFVNAKDKKSTKTETQINGDDTAAVNQEGTQFPQVSVGDTITYEIFWVNNARDPQTGDLAWGTVTVTDFLDENVEFLSASDGGVHDKQANTVTWTFDNQAPGATGTVTVTVEVLEGALKKNEVENSATVDVTNGTTQTTETITNPIEAGDLKVEKTVEGSAGDKEKGFSFKVTLYTDDTLETVADVNGIYGTGEHAMSFEGGVATFTLKDKEFRLAENLPVGLRYVVEEEEDGEYTVYKTGETGLIEKGEEAVASFLNVKDDDPHKKETGRKETGDKGPGDEIIYEGVIPGALITYEISWENTARNEKGEPVAATVTITDVLDKNVEFVDADNGGVHANGTVTWVLEEREPGATGTVTLTVKVRESAADAGQVRNQAGVQVGNDPDVKMTEIVENPVWKPHKTETAIGTTSVTPENPDGDPLYFPVVQVDDTITYEISWKNYKAEAATITIRDILDKNVEFVSASDGGVHANGTVTWVLADREPGAEGTVTVTVRVREGAREAGKVVNTAYVKVGNDDEQQTETVVNPVPNPKKEEVTPGARSVRTHVTVPCACTPPLSALTNSTFSSSTSVIVTVAALF